MSDTTAALRRKAGGAGELQSAAGTIGAVVSGSARPDVGIWKSGKFVMEVRDGYSFKSSS